MDYCNPNILHEVLIRDRSDFLINTAGFTGKPNVDACETDKANCLVGKAVLPDRIAEACELANVPWGHVSSGCIFTGSREDGIEFTSQQLHHELRKARK